MIKHHDQWNLYKLEFMLSENWNPWGRHGSNRDRQKSGNAVLLSMYKVEVVSWNLKPNCLPIATQTGYAMIFIQIEDRWQKTEKWLNDNAFLKIFPKVLYIYDWSCYHADLFDIMFFCHHGHLTLWNYELKYIPFFCKFSLLWCFSTAMEK